MDGNITHLNRVSSKTYTVWEDPNSLFAKITEKVKAVVKKAFKILYAIVCFPSRYLGSKIRTFKSGYHFKSKEHLSPQDLKKYMPYAFADAANNNGNHKFLKKEGYNLIKPKELGENPIEGLELQDECFFDPKSGLKVLLYENNDKVIINFGAAESSKIIIKDIKQFKMLCRKALKRGIGNLLGGIPDGYDQAKRFVKKLKVSNRFLNKNITLSGACIGGSLASYVALKLEIPAVCVNPIALGAGIQQKIGNEALRFADKIITNISIQSDWASDIPLLSPIDRAVSFIGIRTAGIFGLRYIVPTIFGWNFAATHDRALKSLNNHIKSGEKTSQ